MKKSEENRFCQVAKWALLVSGLAYLLVYLGIVFLRINHPFELEWMEGSLLSHVQRILDGHKIYEKPSLDFVSLLYPPFYYYLGALVSWVFGTDFFSLRLISFVSSLVNFLLIFLLVEKETNSRFCGVIASSLFAATFERCGSWFDIARSDSLLLMLLLGAVYLIRLKPGTRGFALAGVLITAAFLVKQSTLLICAPLFVYALFTVHRKSIYLIGTALLGIGGAVLALNATHGGWFFYYCFYLPFHHPAVRQAHERFWTEDILGTLPIACFFSFAFLIVQSVRKKGGVSRFFYLLLSVGMVGSSWSVRTRVGAEVNNLFPAYSLIALVTGLSLHSAASWIRQRGNLTARVLEPVLYLAVLAQLAMLTYDPVKQIPTKADRQAGWKLVARIKKIEGRVFIPHHGYLAVLAGKKGSAHTLSMDNIFLDDRGPIGEDLWKELVGSLREQRYAAVVLESDGRYRRIVLQGYEMGEPVYKREDIFWPVTGGRLRPGYFCFPRTRSHNGYR